MGQYLPERHREQFPFDGLSTVLRKRPYFRRGMEYCKPRRFSMVADNRGKLLLLVEPRHIHHAARYPQS